MRLNFHEEHPFHVGGGLAYYPMVPVTLVGVRGLSVSTYALLDSGADSTIFHAKWAKKIGLDLRSGRPERLRGMTPVSRRIARAVAPGVARWLGGLMRVLEERVADPAARWELLRRSVERIGRGR